MSADGQSGSAPPPIPPRGNKNPRRSGARRGGVGLVLMGAIMGFLGLLIMGLIMGLALSMWTTGSPVVAQYVVDEPDSEDRVALISVEGVILGSGYGSANTVESLGTRLDAVASDPSVRAVVLEIDSPGGGAMASDEIAASIREFRETTGLPVVARLKSVAASGGYYIAAPCDWIVASDLTLTGSIGVILSSFNVRGLLDRVGVRPIIIKSGRFKDMLSAFKSPNEDFEEEVAMLQEVIDETYEKFKSVVREGRDEAYRNWSAEGARALREDWETYADGRVFSGSTAREIGFVDELGSQEEAFVRAKELGDVDVADLVEYSRRARMVDLFSILSEKLERNTGALGPNWSSAFFSIEPGRLYFLYGTLNP